MLRMLYPYEEHKLLPGPPGREKMNGMGVIGSTADIRELAFDGRSKEYFIFGGTWYDQHTRTHLAAFREQYNDFIHNDNIDVGFRLILDRT